MHIRTVMIGTMLMALNTSPVQAAVRKCGAAITSDIATAQTEVEAKKKALKQWQSVAAKRGVGFDSWRLAVGKTLKCFPAQSGFECIAHGAPCIIDQTPRSSPKLPGDKGTGI